MLDGLDAIDWSRLTHAYGPATDVPGLLRALAGSDEAAGERALWELFGNICHQGTVYEATAHAVPFLARLARYGDMPQRDRAIIVALLGAIAAAWSHLEVHGSLLPGGLTGEDEAAKAREMDDVMAARASVGREAPALFADLDGVEERTDWRLAALAAQVPEFAASAAPLIESMQGRTDNPRLRAALDLTSALIAGDATPEVVDAAAAAFEPERAAGLEDPAELSPERRGRLVAEYLYEDGFDETHVGGGRHDLRAAFAARTRQRGDPARSKRLDTGGECPAYVLAATDAQVGCWRPGQHVPRPTDRRTRRRRAAGLQMVVGRPPPGRA